jgi:hypothetical protein
LVNPGRANGRLAPAAPLPGLERAVVELRTIGPRLASTLGNSAWINVDAETLDHARAEATRRLAYHLDRAAGAVSGR